MDRIAGLRELVQTHFGQPEMIRRARQQIRQHTLENSRYLRQGNFRSIHPSDLAGLFFAYDRLFFDGHCARLTSGADHHLSFRLSSRMTNAGGKTSAWTSSRPASGQRQRRFEIAVSTTLLFESFRKTEDLVVVVGLDCRDRLDALQRIVEHEIIHLVEFLLWNDSSCSRERFQAIAFRLFGHTQSHHELTTPGEAARTDFNIDVGDFVSFALGDDRHYGFVNHIQRRATVLVPDAQGDRYSDGKRYAKFYVPLQLLRRE